MHRTRALRRTLLIVAVITTAACGAPSSEPPEKAPTTTPVSLERVATVGCGDCAGERQVTPVALAILSGERIAVLDAYEPFVRVFGTDGELQQSYGTKGQGPGELGMELPGAGYLPGLWLFGNELDGVTVLDIFPFSFEAFDEQGNYVGSTATGLPDAVPTAQAFDPDSHTYYRISFSPMDDASRAIYRCRVGDLGAVSCERFVDPVTFLQPEGSPGATIGSLVTAAAPDGSLVIANVGSYDIWVVGEDGEVVVRSGRDLPLPRMSEAEIEDLRQRYEARGRPLPDGDRVRMHIENYGLQVDGAGRIWALTGRYGDTDSVFDVFAADGPFLDEIVIDAVIRRTNNGITPFTVRDDLLAAAAQLPDGNQEIRVYRIRAQ